jgi:23S rRNA (cytosine1962-C5)-methyltransferase
MDARTLSLAYRGRLAANPAGTDRLKVKPADRSEDTSALRLVESRGFADYALLDSGNGRKLERFGRITVDRPEPQAMWASRLAAERWGKADAVFAGGEDEEAGKWRRNRELPESWPVRVRDVTVLCRLTAFRHLGLFPEQRPHWEWMLAGLAAMRVERPRVLNLFAYTGVATLLAAKAGAEVTHIDASKRAIAWARENQRASGLEQAPVRWLLDDAVKFTQREVRRGRTYNLILIDPPKFGRGPANETWELFEHLPQLLKDCTALLERSNAMLVLTAYAIRASSLAIDQLTREALSDRGGRFASGELAIREEHGARALPTSLFTRWSSDDIGL